MAKAQKCGGVHIKMMRTSNKAFGSIVLVTEAHPNKGGAAPANPPITIF